LIAEILDGVALKVLQRNYHHLIAGRAFALRKHVGERRTSGAGQNACVIDNPARKRRELRLIRERRTR